MTLSVQAWDYVQMTNLEQICKVLICTSRGWMSILLHWQFSPKCSKSRDLTAIAICDSNRESQITSDLRQCEPCQKRPMFWLVVQEFGIAILTAIWTGAQITNRAIRKCDLSCPRQRFWGNFLRWSPWRISFLIIPPLKVVIALFASKNRSSYCWRATILRELLSNNDTR